MPPILIIRCITSNFLRPSDDLAVETPLNIKNIFQFKSF